MPSIEITSIGTYSPPHILTNRDLERLLDQTAETLTALDCTHKNVPHWERAFKHLRDDRGCIDAGRIRTDDAWITPRTGIRERRVAGPEEDVYTMGEAAARDALTRASIPPEEYHRSIDLIIGATSMRPYRHPSLAGVVSKRLLGDGAGVRTDTGVYDVQAGCSGFVYALRDAYNELASHDDINRVLIIASEHLTQYMPMHLRDTCVLFGDGAGAVIVERTGREGKGVIDSFRTSEGDDNTHLGERAGLGFRLRIDPDREGYFDTTLTHSEHWIHMDGRAVFKFATDALPYTTNKLLERNRLAPADLDSIVPHNANQRIIDLQEKRLRRGERPFAGEMLLNLARYGNTSAASIRWCSPSTGIGCAARVSAPSWPASAQASPQGRCSTSSRRRHL